MKARSDEWDGEGKEGNSEGHRGTNGTGQSRAGKGEERERGRESSAFGQGTSEGFVSGMKKRNPVAIAKLFGEVRGWEKQTKLSEHGDMVDEESGGHQHETVRRV
ncbi:hypothetical protein TRVL_07885 [Trypanosoma vivax]|nr:hypothetical protein TRVL_07885 [Trypanosoma vivax]